ncbi:hypothetical protein BJ165DRAFT_1610475 [Panaeolus papilionaceus]|nr:hypothetical protein BJ165DRAFT_1610475 [Panaeolus papilionaceus]
MSASSIPDIVAGTSGLPDAGSLPATGVAVGGLMSLLNPFTPLAFLPPSDARQVTVVMFVLVASLTIMLWDVLNNLRSDYMLLTRRRFGLPTAVYFFSRVVNLAYQLGTVIISTAPVGNCMTTSVAINALFPLAIPSTSLLLFFQVRAIYIRNNALVAFFGFMWIAVVGACATTVIAARSAFEIGPTKYCIVYGSLKSYSSSPAIVVLVNDTLMFMCIVYKVLQCSSASSSGLKMGVKTFLFGTSLPTLSKALLQNGQVYFLSTVGINIITVIIFYIDRIPVPYRLIMGIPDIVLMNVMACRIYRNTKLGIFSLPVPPPNTWNTHRFNHSAPSGVVISVTKQLEKSPSTPTFETLNIKQMAFHQAKKPSPLGSSSDSRSSIDRTTIEQDHQTSPPSPPF